MIMDPRRTLKLFLAIALILIITLYAVDKTKNLIIGPEINIRTPLNGAIVAESVLEIEGTARNISKISINDRQILIDQNGLFRDQLVVSVGYNIISVVGKDRFGKIKKVELEIIRKENN